MPRPTEAQKEAGNYAKHHIRLHGLPIAIENRKGTVRSGEDSAGRPWSVVMPYDYGYLKRTVGADGDHVDVFLGPHRNSQFVVVVNQHEKQTGRFEEVKVGLGYLTLEQAKAAYHQGYRGRHVPRATFKTTTVQRLKEWLRLRQTWTQFDLNHEPRLTNFGAGMKKPAKQEDKPSVARRVAATLGAGAAVAGFYRYAATRPDAVKRRNDLKGRQYAAGLAKQPAPTATPPYSGGDKFDYGVTQKPPATVAAPVNKRFTNNSERRTFLRHEKYVAGLRGPSSVKASPYSGGDKFDYGVTPKAPAPTQPAAVKRVRGSVIERNVLGKTLKPKVKAKVHVSTKFSARLALIQFQEKYADGTFAVSTSPLTAYRKASRVVPWVGRAGQAAGDIGDIASGKKVKDPFYKKPWFKRAVTTAAIGLPLLGASLAHSGARKNADGTPVNKSKTYAGYKDRLERKAAAAKERLDRKLGLSAKLKPILLQAVNQHVVEFMKTVGGGFRPPVFGRLDDSAPHVAAMHLAPEWVEPNVKSGALNLPDHAKETAIKRGVVLQRSPEFYAKADRDGGAFFGKQGAAKNARAHELVHAIQRHRQGPVKSVADDLKREWGAYSRTLLGKNAARKMAGGAGKFRRAIAAVSGTLGSTAVNTLTAAGKRPLFSAKLKPVLLQAVLNHVANFDYASDLRGWDLRDPRGRSARVYAPGSKRRERREKTWGEKTDNIRLVRNIAIAGTIGAGGLALHYRNKANRLAPKAAAPNLAPVTPVDFRKVKQASAAVRTMNLSRKDEPVGIHGLIDATKANLPGRPELPGEGVAKHIASLPPKKRAGVLRILGAGTLAAGGALGGTVLKRPRTGALVGGLGAGLLLG